jgi:uncharacterized membrane protein
MARALYGTLALLTLINLVLSGVILIENRAEANAMGCFASGGGCATVHASKYSHLLGIPNPYIGLVAFSVWAVAFVVLLLAPRHPKHPTQKYKRHIALFLAIGMIAGALFSLWMVYLQFFVIHAICVYCMWVDVIMVVSTVAVIATHKTELQYFTR